MSDFIDPYIDPVTKVLNNLVGATSYRELRRAEGDIVAMAEISLENVPHTIDLTELCRIHYCLFSKIYEWAGELRTVNIRKGSKEYFLDCKFLENGVAFVLNALREEKCLRGLGRDDFAKRLAYFYEQLNFVHPFREGNGRTQRIFWQKVANEAGYRIDWSEVVGDELDEASIAGRVEHDLRPLEKMFSKIVISA